MSFCYNNDAARPELLDLTNDIDGNQDVNGNESAADKQKLQELESKETFHVYFPEGSMTNLYGGKETSREFKKIVEEAQSKVFEGEVVADLSREFCNDYMDNIFINS